MDVDSVYNEIGEFGYQQKKYAFVLNMIWLCGPFHTLAMVFVGANPGFECFPTESSGNGSLMNDCPGHQLESCSKIIFHPDRTSIVTEWNLVCDRSYIAKSASAFFMFGMTFGAFCFGRMSDHHGRKATAYLAFTLQTIFGATLNWAPSSNVLIFLRTLQGFAHAGNLSVFVLSVEYAGTSKRGFVGSVGGCAFSCGIVVYACLAYIFRDWRTLNSVAMVIGSMILLGYFYVPESPHWLWSQGRLSEATAVLRRIAAGNSVHFKDSWTLSPPPERKKHFLPVSSPRKDGFRALLSSRIILALTVVQMFSWFTNACVYYGLTLAAGDIGSNLYTSAALSGAVEIPGILTSFLLIQTFGRRLPLSGFMVVAGLSCLSIQCLPYPSPTGESVKLVLALIGKMCVTASFNIIFIHSAEIYPTDTRSSALGILNVTCRLGSVLSPFVGLADAVMHNLQFTVLGLLSLLAGLWNLALPETHGQTLPHTLEEVLRRLKKSGSHPPRKNAVACRGDLRRETTDEDTSRLLPTESWYLGSSSDETL